MHYSSWAQLGAHVQAAGTAVPTLAVYAEDVVTQLRYNALLGYKGAPVYDDLDGLNIVNAFEVLNRSASAARQFFLLLHAQPSFHTLGLRPYWKKSFEMRRTGTSTVLTQNEEWFHVSMFMSAYKKPAWPDGAGAYAAFSFYAEDNPLLHVGAFLTTSNEVLYQYDWSDDAEILTDPRLAAYAGPDLAIKAVGDRSEWLYDERPWVPGQQDSDITWTIQRLQGRGVSVRLKRGPRSPRHKSVASAAPGSGAWSSTTSALTTNRRHWPDRTSPPSLTTKLLPGVRAPARHRLKVRVAVSRDLASA